MYILYYGIVLLLINLLQEKDHECSLKEMSVFVTAYTCARYRKGLLPGIWEKWGHYGSRGWGQAWTAWKGKR